MFYFLIFIFYADFCESVKICIFVFFFMSTSVENHDHAFELGEFLDLSNFEGISGISWDVPKDILKDNAYDVFRILVKLVL